MSFCFDEVFTDPKMVGQSEYQAIYDVCNNPDWHNDPEFLITILDEFIGIARGLIIEIVKKS